MALPHCYQVPKNEDASTTKKHLQIRSSEIYRGYLVTDKISARTRDIYYRIKTRITKNHQSCGEKPLIQPLGGGQKVLQPTLEPHSPTKELQKGLIWKWL